MSVYKDQEFGTWRVVFRYTDWQGHSRQTQKLGFATRREAVAWEAEQKAIKRVNQKDISGSKEKEINRDA